MQECKKLLRARVQKHLQNAILCTSFWHVISPRFVFLEDASPWYSYAKSRHLKCRGPPPKTCLAGSTMKESLEHSSVPIACCHNC